MMTPETITKIKDLMAQASVNEEDLEEFREQYGLQDVAIRKIY